ncbi:MAG: EI24 domain-containing protein [Alphaproteobacteria bacterium]
MEILIQSFTRAIRSLSAPGMIKVFVLSVALTLFTLILFIFVVGGVANYFLSGTEYWVLAWLATLGGTVISWLLFPGIMPIIVNFFDVKIAGLIEQQNYPAATPLANPPFWPELLHDARFSLFVVLANILVLPLYLIPVINVVLFYWLNGYLLGREFFIMTARRHMPIPEARALWQTRSRTITIAGMGLALMATIPLINLVAPFWGIAVMTHIFHGLKGTPKTQILPPI